MTPQDLQKRTKRFALEVMKVCAILEKQPLAKLVGRQMFRSTTSTAANYRAACRSKSAKDFVAKLGIVIEEVDETCFWLELLLESNMYNDKIVETLLKEARELTAIMVASRNSAIRNQRQG